MDGDMGSMPNGMQFGQQNNAEIDFMSQAYHDGDGHNMVDGDSHNMVDGHTPGPSGHGRGHGNTNPSGRVDGYGKGRGDQYGQMRYG